MNDTNSKTNNTTKVKDPNLCNYQKCKKSIELLSFKCKCELIFCIKHKNTFAHYCQYDYRNATKKKLEESNPKIECKKLDKI